MVYQDNPGCDTTFYKVCSEYWFNAMSLRIQKHPKSTEMAVNLSLICAGMILTVKVDFPKVSGEKKSWFVWECSCVQHVYAELVNNFFKIVLFWL